MSDQTTVSRPKRQQTAELPQADDSNRPGVGLPGVLLLGLLPFGLALACSESSPQQADNVETTPATALVLKTTVGLDFEHDNGATGAYNYPEMMQGGAGFLDFDGDGLLDIYMVQSGELPPSASQTKTNRLFRNLGHRDFRDVTSAARVGDNGYGSGLATGDFDGDGLADLFITNLGSNRLYRNLGNGSFEDATERLSGDPRGYSTCAAFFDMDGDGDLDLFVCNYVEWSAALETRCLGFNGQQGYCGPQEYKPAPDELYRNDKGRFTSVTAESGIGAVASATLGLAAVDFDGDGDLDLYTANDQMANHLWVNDGRGKFVDEGLERGAAFNQQGFPEAGMGVIAEDFDEDGDWDLFVTHLGNETNTLYLNDEGLFFDSTDALGLGAVSQAYTGFGVGLFDFDGDGLRDLMVANGRVSHGDDLSTNFGEPDQLLRGQASGRFEEASLEGSPAVSRAIAFGDLDNDGATDALVGLNNGSPRLYFGQPAAGGEWLGVQVLGVPQADAPGLGNFALHCRVTLVLTSGKQLHRRTETSSSYAAANDPRVLFRIASGDLPIRLEVTWPDGSSRDVSSPATGRYHQVAR